jgi:thioredoxin reductase (NADPH)
VTMSVHSNQDAGREDVLDCLIIGRGPAGFTTAVYLARYRRSVAVYSEGKSRAAYIPKSHNYPGFPSGVSGFELIELLNKQANPTGSLSCLRHQQPVK